MCFSASASFIGGAVITTIGVITLLKVHKPNQVVFACIPLFFGLQQFAEGFVWMGLQYPYFAPFLTPATYIFLIMAQVFWPFMIPLAVLLMERKRKRKIILRILLAMGVSVSVYFTARLLFATVTPEISGYHIEYVEDFNRTLRSIVFGIYLIASIVPLFVSSIKRIYILGLLMTFSCIVTMVFFAQFLTSVWCFFGAAMSVVILWILRDARRKYLLGRIV